MATENSEPAFHGLVIGREVDQGIDITLPDGRKIRIRVIEIRGGRMVRLVFQADKDIRILRSELGDHTGAN